MTQDINFGAISEALNNKMDRDVQNISGGGKQYILMLGLPDYSKTIDITDVLYSTKQYTAPTDGILYNAMIPTSGTPIKINGNTIGIRQYSTYGNWIPTPYILSKGDVFSVNTFISNVGGASFVPFKGVEQD